MSVWYIPHFAPLRWRLTMLGQRLAPAGSLVPRQSSAGVPLHFFAAPAGTARRIHSRLSQSTDTLSALRLVLPCTITYRIMFQHACTQFALLSGAIFKPECRRFSGTYPHCTRKASVYWHSQRRIKQNTHFVTLCCIFSLDDCIHCRSRAFRAC